VRAVVFDLDGVIIDTEEVWEEVRRGYVAEHGREFLPDSQSRMMGMSTGEWSTHLSAEVGVPRTPEQVAADVLARMAERYRVDLPLIPGSVDAVRRLAERFPVALASSSARILIDQVLETAGLTGTFRVTLSTEEVPRGKPAPDVYLAAVERLGLTPEVCAAVEDSSNGLRSAAAAGLAVIAVPHGVYPPAADALALASLVIDGPARTAGPGTPVRVVRQVDAGAALADDLVRQRHEPALVVQPVADRQAVRRTRGQEAARARATLLRAPREGADQGLVAREGDGVVPVRRCQLARERVGRHQRRTVAHAADGRAAGRVPEQGDPPARPRLDVHPADLVEVHVVGLVQRRQHARHLPAQIREALAHQILLRVEVVPVVAQLG
jgi:HAD superfamily hydrolase (TIGR01509 family)